MIKDGRPYSKHRDGYVDDKLITECNPEVRTAVDAWIAENIRPRKTVNDASSYMLKHILERETGIYLTNNAFKDAMLLNGYRPVNPNELNWKYRIQLKRKNYDGKTV